jgi:hypothetical protein
MIPLLKGPFSSLYKRALGGFYLQEKYKRLGNLYNLLKINGFFKA